MAGQDTPFKHESANDRQVAGAHYKKPIEHWDIVAMLNLDYYQGQISKYVFRWRDKAGIVDLEKALHVLQKYIEVEKARQSGTLDEQLLGAALSRHIERGTYTEDEAFGLVSVGARVAAAIDTAASLGAVSEPPGPRVVHVGAAGCAPG